MLIDNRTVQAFLKSKGFYRGRVDGDYGPASRAAARRFLADTPRNQTSYLPAWNDDRVRAAVEQAVMESIGQDLGVLDGLPGPRTQIALERWQDHVQFSAADAEDDPARPTEWPRQRDMEAFYGKPGTNHTQIVPPYPVFYGNEQVRKITINARCADSALRIMNRVREAYGESEIKRLGLDRFGGCFNNRTMRNGSQLSTHAYACAWDWDPVRNPLRATASTAQFANPEYAAFIDAHEAEGWVSLGRARNFDWMHFQAARL